MGISDDARQSKNCSRGKFPHISLRASDMSSSEMERPASFQSPRSGLPESQFCSFNCRKLTKSKTSCCLSIERLRNAATTFCSIAFASIASYYLDSSTGLDRGFCTARSNAPTESRDQPATPRAAPQSPIPGNSRSLLLLALRQQDPSYASL